ncbi:hypothetical protein [Aurantiacibacter spongiae]|uniref:Hydrolase 2, exosortase A system-associated n=1 Tax=Aurantiacibacter spongiae TaxID=2488860 RepID=A0A3N5CJ65_9SPHN|nr:hypothetical protein [Aurantiacibacter spongiae]RPF68837.1 hypothetical protein EG799_13855 [Aurantiacibacter spongiae]
MRPATWAPSSGSAEYLLRFDRQRERRALVVPALFDEGHKLRHFTVEIMRRLDRAGIDSLLPDLPGLNESLAPLGEQSLDRWRTAIAALARESGVTHVVTLRAGALIDPGVLPGLCYAPVRGETILRALLRARILADREAGHDTSRETLLAHARREGCTLAGFELGPAMIAQLETAAPPRPPAHQVTQSDLPGPGLWLRAEPAHDAAQADALAAIVAERFA